MPANTKAKPKPNAAQIIKDIESGAFTKSRQCAGFFKMSQEDQDAAGPVIEAYAANKLKGAPSGAAVLRGLQQAGIPITRSIFEGYVNVVKTRG